MIEAIDTSSGFAADCSSLAALEESMRRLTPTIMEREGGARNVNKWRATATFRMVANNVCFQAVATIASTAVIGRIAVIRNADNAVIVGVALRLRSDLGFGGESGRPCAEL